MSRTQDRNAKTVTFCDNDIHNLNLRALIAWSNFKEEATLFIILQAFI